jgi:pimeloyl-ACP methyl ester carboxylesterase
MVRWPADDGRVGLRQLAPTTPAGPPAAPAEAHDRGGGTVPAMTVDVLDDPLVILVHGAWHGAWAFAALQAELDHRGVPSLAVDLPGHGASILPLADLVGDATHVVAVVDRLARPVLLVGHSYGGAVVTEAAGRTTWARGLVYLAGFALDAGESVRTIAKVLPHHTALDEAVTRQDDGTTVLDPVAAVGALYAHSPLGVAAAALERVGPQSVAGFQQRVTVSPRSSLPSTYVVCTLDHAVHPEQQRMMAARCTRTVELETDHSPQVSATGAVADVIDVDYRALTR